MSRDLGSMPMTSSRVYIPLSFTLFHHHPHLINVVRRYRRTPEQLIYVVDSATGEARTALNLSEVEEVPQQGKHPSLFLSRCQDRSTLSASTTPAAGDGSEVHTEHVNVVEAPGEKPSFKDQVLGYAKVTRGTVSFFRAANGKVRLLNSNCLNYFRFSARLAILINKPILY